MDKEYIEREAVLRRKRKMSGADFGGDFWDEAVLCEDIWKIPKADVAEVKHGQWVYDHWCEFKCSECGSWSNSEPYKGEENYCPNCGAKMDGKKLLTWIPRDNWELGCEYECPYCGASIDVPHGGIMPHKCWKCGNEIGVK